MKESDPEVIAAICLIALSKPQHVQKALYELLVIKNEPNKKKQKYMSLNSGLKS